MADFVNSLGPVAWLVVLVVGAAMLFIGRKLFWLLVGVIGSLVGLVVATELLQAQPDWIIYLAAFVGGIIGALLALFVQKIAVAVAGFLMGGYGLVWLFELLAMGSVVEHGGLGHALAAQPSILHQVGRAHAALRQGTEDAIAGVQERAFGGTHFICSAVILGTMGAQQLEPLPHLG